MNHTYIQIVAIQTYIAGLKSTIQDLEEEVAKAKMGDDDAHSHYHGNEKCTADHSHDQGHGEEDTGGDACGHSHEVRI